MDVPGFTLKSEDFELTDFSKPFPCLQLFRFYSPVHACALTWCTRDNPVCAVPAQRYKGNTVDLASHCTCNDGSLPVTSLSRGSVNTSTDCV